MTTLVKNASKGYGYNYASLADIANQGYEIPIMKTEVVSEREYVFYFSKAINEWVQGAQVVIPEAKGMNKAQLYGSALTYARRYTTLLALGLACGDDATIENLTAEGYKKDYPITTDQVKDLRSQLYNNEEIELNDKQVKWIMEKKGYKSAFEVTQADKEWFVKELEKAKNGKTK